MRPETLHRNAAFRDPTHDQGEAACPTCVADAATYPPAPPQRTELHDGLEFTRPTWDKTPTPWNQAGSWVDDPETDARCEAAIRAAVPNHAELAAEALTAVRVPISEWCGTFWGSHGCGREKGHPGLCVCDPDPTGEGGPCSAGLKYGDSSTLILWWSDPVGLRLSSLHWTWFR